MKRMFNFFSKQYNSTLRRYFVFNFLSQLTFFSAVLVPFFTNLGHISITQIQFLQSWFMFWFFIFEIPTGALADFIGRKYTMAFGALFIALAVFIDGSFPFFGAFMVSEFIFAWGASLISGADEALLYEALKEEGRESEIKEMFGKSNSIELTAMLISASLGGLIASKWGLNSPFLYTAIPMILASIVAWTIKEPRVHEKRKSSKNYLTIAKSGLVFLSKHKYLRVLTLDSVLVALACYFVIWFYQPLLQSINISIFYFGFIHSFLVGSEILVSSNFGRLEKWFGSAKSLIGFSTLATAVTFILVAALPNLWTIFLFLFFAGGFGLTRGKLISSYMNKFINSEERATVLSSASLFRRFGLVILNPLVGLLADHSLRLALLSLSLLPLAVFIFSPLEHEMFKEETDKIG